MLMSPPVFPRYRPDFPFEALPEPIRGAVLQAVRERDIPAPVALVDAIAAAAAVVHCGYDCVAPDGEHLPTTINTCVVAPSAAGKGRSIRFFFRRFLEKQLDRQAMLVDGPEGDEEDSGRGSKAKAFARTPIVEAMINSVSYARLMREIGGRGMNLTIQREEGASFLNSDLFKKNTDALTQLWSGNPPLDHFVMGKEIVAAEARVSLGFRIQPDLMYEYLRGNGRHAVKLGFWPRTIAACYDPEMFPESDWHPSAQTSAYDGQAFQQRVNELADAINNRRSGGCRERIGVSLDQCAMGFMLELGFRMKQWWRTSHFRDIPEAAGRGWENTLRLAAVLHVFCNGTGPVTLEMVRRAWDIVEWSLLQHYLIFVFAPASKTTSPSQAGGLAPLNAARPSAPKRQRIPQPLQDAHFLLACLDRLRCTTASPLLSDLRLLSGLSKRRFQVALEWLKLETMVRVSFVEPVTIVRMR